MKGKEEDGREGCLTGERAAKHKEALKGAGCRSRRGCREGQQMEDDNKGGAWERQKDGGEQKWRG